MPIGPAFRHSNRVGAARATTSSAPSLLQSDEEVLEVHPSGFSHGTNLR